MTTVTAVERHLLGHPPAGRRPRERHDGRARRSHPGGRDDPRGPQRHRPERDGTLPRRPHDGRARSSIKPATVSGFVYWNTANNSTFVRATDPVLSGAVATLYGPRLINLSATTDASGAFQILERSPGRLQLHGQLPRGESSASRTCTRSRERRRTKRSASRPATVRATRTSSNGFAAADAAVTVSTDSLGLVRTATVELERKLHRPRTCGPGTTRSGHGPGRLARLPRDDVPRFRRPVGSAQLNLTLVPLVTVTRRSS